VSATGPLGLLFLDTPVDSSSSARLNRISATDYVGIE